MRPCYILHVVFVSSLILVHLVMIGAFRNYLLNFQTIFIFFMFTKLIIFQLPSNVGCICNFWELWSGVNLVIVNGFCVFFFWIFFVNQVFFSSINWLMLDAFGKLLLTKLALLLSRSKNFFFWKLQKKVFTRYICFNAGMLVITQLKSTLNKQSVLNWKLSCLWVQHQLPVFVSVVSEIQIFAYISISYKNCSKSRHLKTTWHVKQKKNDWDWRMQRFKYISILVIIRRYKISS